MAARRDLDFGTTMRRAREARGISLRQIAAATRISVAALEALERNDISRLPGGIFSRAFVRSYAVEVGLDPEQTVRDFLEQFPHDSVTAGSPHVPHEDHQAVESDRRSAETALKLLAISVPLAGAILYATLWRPRPAETLAFELVAKAPVTVTVDDGARTLGAGDRFTFRSGREVRLEVSDAAAVHLTINGRVAAPLGPPGAASAVAIGLNNYKSFLAVR